MRSASAGRALAEEPWDGFTLRCFGTFTVSSAEGAVALTGVRPVALTVLRILAVHAGHPVHRDALVSALWTDLPESASLHNLHVAVSNLRHRLERFLPGRSRELLARQGQAYLLAPGNGAVSDLQLFDLRLADAKGCRRAGDRTGEAHALRAALDLYTGEVLPGDGPADWVVPIREHYRLRAAGAASELAGLELSRERAAAAVAAAQRSIEIDQWRDSSWQVLIAAHEMADQPAEAHRARQEYAAVLGSLGIGAITRGPIRPEATKASPGRVVRTA